MGTKLAQKTEGLNASNSTTASHALGAYQGKILDDIKLEGTYGTSRNTTTIGDTISNGQVYFQYATTTASTVRNALLNALFPVGSIYQTTSSTAPGDLFGGTWTQDGLSGRILLGTNSTYAANSTGGSDAVTLTALQSGTPAHTSSTNGAHTHHAITLKIAQIAKSGSNRTIYDGGGTGGTSTYWSSWSDTHGHWVGSVNASSSHDNMPPYLVIYTWRRTN